MPNNSFFDIKLFCSSHHRIEISFPTVMATQSLTSITNPQIPLTLYLLFARKSGLVTSKTSKSLANVFTGDFMAACFFGDFGDPGGETIFTISITSLSSLESET